MTASPCIPTSWPSNAASDTCPRSQRHKPVHEWNLGALAGAGAIRSTAADMLTYLEANLHPGKYPALAGALLATQRVRQYAGAGAQIGLAWTYHPETGAYRHGGTTAGFTSHAFFIQRYDCAAIVLMNSVETGKRLVQQKQIGIVEEGGGEEDFLPHSFGVSRDGDVPVAMERQQPEQAVDPFG